MSLIKSTNINGELGSPCFSPMCESKKPDSVDLYPRLEGLDGVYWLENNGHFKYWLENNKQKNYWLENNEGLKYKE